MTGPSLLVIENRPSLSMRARSALTNEGIRIETADSLVVAMEKCAARRPAVALLDMRDTGYNGLHLMRACLTVSPCTRFILVTASSAVPQVVEAMRAGAFDYLVFPGDEPRLVAVIAAALRPDKTPRRGAPPVQVELIGRSPTMRSTFERIAAVSPSRGTVFITGESGTGKELCARAVHQNSKRARGPFVSRTCSGLTPDDLTPGDFDRTAPVPEHPGIAALANGGTLFLDEICELAPALQCRLLSLLELCEAGPPDPTHPRGPDVRIICATNRDPQEEVRNGRLREDLFYRLFVLPIHMPPLRARAQDVIEIAERTLQQLATEEGRTFTGLSNPVKAAFLAYPWPGNVRQLKNLLRQIVVMHRGPTVELDMLPDDLRQNTAINGDTAPAPAPDQPPLLNPALVGRPMTDIERLVIEATISAENGSVPRAADVLGMSPSTIYRKREKWR